MGAGRRVDSIGERGGQSNCRPGNGPKGFPVQFSHTINEKPDPKIYKLPKSIEFIQSFI